MLTAPLSFLMDRMVEESVPVLVDAAPVVGDCLIMERIQSADPEGIAVLHDRYAGLLKGLIMKIVRNDAESDDILQDVFLEIWRCAGQFDPSKGSPLTWIVTMARRRAIDKIRKWAAYGRMEERLILETEASAEQCLWHVSEDAELSEMRLYIKRTMALLPPLQFQVIQLAYFGGLSQRDISAVTGIPLGTIKTRLALGLKKLAVALHEFGDLI